MLVELIIVFKVHISYLCVVLKVIFQITDLHCVTYI